MDILKKIREKSEEYETVVIGILGIGTMTAIYLVYRLIINFLFQQV